MTDAQASALPRLSVGDRVRVIARLDIPNPHDLPIGYVGVVEEVFPNGDVDLGEWACRRDEVELVGDEPVRAVPAPTGDMVLVPREPTELMLTDGVLAGTFPWTDVIPPGVDEDRYVLAAIYRAMIAAAPSPSASTIGVDVDALAQEIRRVDGRHDLGAGALAEALMPFLGRCQSSAGGEGVVEALREALAPFAREADEWADTVPDDYRSLCTEPGSETALPGSETAYTVGDLRRARSVYNASLSPPKAETERDKTMLRGALWELREYAAMDARDGPAGAVVNVLGQAAYDWLGDRIEAFVADQFSELPAPKAETETALETMAFYVSDADIETARKSFCYGTVEGFDGMVRISDQPKEGWSRFASLTPPKAETKTGDEREVACVRERRDAEGRFVWQIVSIRPERVRTIKSFGPGYSGRRQARAALSTETVR